MSIAVIPLRPEHVPTIARICFDAFTALQDRHGVERDFDSPATTEMLFGMLATRPDFSGYVAVDQHPSRPEEILGSNFIMLCDSVAAVGPITVKPDAQGKGAGQLLMHVAMAEAYRRGITKIRLFQEAINVASLSLYTNVGYDWRFAAALIRPKPSDADDPRIRPVTLDDLPMVDSLSARGFHDSRVNEVAGFLRYGFPGFILIREGPLGEKLVGGYFFPGMLGHGFAASATDMADLVVHAARNTPPHFHKALLPLDQGELHRLLMERGCRTIKLFNSMTVGEYTPPIGAWMPSIGM